MLYSLHAMTRVGAYCFDSRPLALILFTAAAIVLFAPSVFQAALLLFVGTCPVTAVAGVCKAARFHVCGQEERDGFDQGEPVPGPYASLVGEMFGKRK